MTDNHTEMDQAAREVASVKIEHTFTKPCADPNEALTVLRELLPDGRIEFTFTDGTKEIW